ncbi:MAG: Uma2 family endonuclease [Planctomycetaceae bacterium]|nr:Uma2 family endonuclease [Planctomycetaceae bacterium]
MATATTSKAGAHGQRFVLYDIGWEGYQTLLRVVGERPVRVTYDRGNVELMTTSPIHEIYKHLLGRMVDTIGEELDIPMFGQGSTTINREDVDRGLEPDECYYIANAGRVADRSQLNLETDPPPDLAIEIEITRNVLDRLGIYAALGVPEVWRFDGEALRVLLLGADGTYSPSESSAAFPFLPMKEMTRFLREYDRNNDTRWGREFRTWVRNEIGPRFHP